MTANKDELLKRVTGNRVTPQARPQAKKELHLLPGEEAALRQAGWTPDMGLPSNMSQILADLKNQPTSADAEEPYSGPEDNEPTGTNSGDFLANLETYKKPVFTSGFKAPEASSLLGEFGDKSALQKAMEAAKKKKQEEELKKAFLQQDPVKVANSLKDAIEKAAEKDVAKSAEPVHEHKFETGVSEFAVCIHCGRNQKTPALETPHIDKRRAYHWAFLGDKPYQDETALYDGTINITVRTLRTGEHDWIVNQAGLIMKSRYPDSQAFPTQDYFELITRLRVGLQLVRVAKSTQQGPVIENYPESLKEWLDLLKEMDAVVDPKNPGLTLLRFFNESLCATESVYRVYGRVVDNFNTQVDKLEIMWGTPDFLNETV